MCDDDDDDDESSESSFFMNCGVLAATPNFGQLFSGQFCNFAPIKVGRFRLILANFLKP